MPYILMRNLEVNSIHVNLVYLLYKIFVVVFVSDLYLQVNPNEWFYVVFQEEV